MSPREFTERHRDGLARSFGKMLQEAMQEAKQELMASGMDEASAEIAAEWAVGNALNGFARANWEGPRASQ